MFVAVSVLLLSAQQRLTTVPSVQLKELCSVPCRSGWSCNRPASHAGPACLPLLLLWLVAALWCQVRMIVQELLQGLRSAPVSGVRCTAEFLNLGDARWSRMKVGCVHIDKCRCD